MACFSIHMTARLPALPTVGQWADTLTNVILKTIHNVIAEEGDDLAKRTVIYAKATASKPPCAVCNGELSIKRKAPLAAYISPCKHIYHAACLYRLLSDSTELDSCVYPDPDSPHIRNGANICGVPILRMNVGPSLPALHDISAYAKLRDDMTLLYSAAQEKLALIERLEDQIRLHMAIRPTLDAGWGRGILLKVSRCTERDIRKIAAAIPTDKMPSCAAELNYSRLMFPDVPSFVAVHTATTSTVEQADSKKGRETETFVETLGTRLVLTDSANTKMSGSDREKGKVGKLVGNVLHTARFFTDKLPELYYGDYA